jgi:DNA recombination protein RmuC
LIRRFGGFVPIWIEIVLGIQLSATVLLVFLVILFRRNSDPKEFRSISQAVERLLDIGSKTDTKVDLLATRHDQFVSNSAQASSNLRTDLLAALSAEFSVLRQEVVNSITQIGSQTRGTLEELRTSTNSRLDKLTGDLTTEHTSLREALNTRLTSSQAEVTTRFNDFQRAQTEQGNSSREAIDATLSRLSRDIKESVSELKADVNTRIQEMVQQTAALKDSAELQQTALRQSVEQRLEKLSEQNTKKLDEMRETVDEKLHKTLESRLTQSFGLVTDQLGKVQTGLGEMKELAVNVGDLKRVLNNVSTRGTLGNTLLGAQLEQVLAPSQFAREVRIRPNTDERVDYVIRLPFSDDEPVLLPVDSKFPKEDWERLEEAGRLGDALAIDAARRALELRIKTEAKKIAEKYIYPPITTNFAFMYLPSEALFSEALRIPGLVDELQLKHRVSLAGPTNFMAILNSLQMGFRTLAIQKKSSEVWQLLATTKVEFQNFGTLMTKVEKQVGTVQNTIKDVNAKTRTINKKLRSVEVLELGADKSTSLLNAGSESDETLEDDVGEMTLSTAEELEEGTN